MQTFLTVKKKPLYSSKFGENEHDLHISMSKHNGYESNFMRSYNYANVIKNNNVIANLNKIKS